MNLQPPILREKQSRAVKTVAAVERLARSDEIHTATIGQWDANLWLLNTPDGTVDLRSGEMRTHQPQTIHKDNSRRSKYRRCRSMAHLQRILNDDAKLIAYLQRVIGYYLTGVATEHALFFCYGTGANGKGVTITRFQYPERLRPIGSNRDIHCNPYRSPLNRARCLDGCKGCDRHRNRGRPALGRKPHQTTDRRRQDPRAVHAAGRIRIHAAAEAPDLGQSQAGTAVRR